MWTLTTPPTHPHTHSWFHEISKPFKGIYSYIRKVFNKQVKELKKCYIGLQGSSSWILQKGDGISGYTEMYPQLIYLKLFFIFCLFQMHVITQENYTMAYFLQTKHTTTKNQSWICHVVEDMNWLEIKPWRVWTHVRGIMKCQNAKVSHFFIFLFFFTIFHFNSLTECMC